jgi:peroxisomal 3,2-trans-enoyl-CoA isomerase
MYEEVITALSIAQSLDTVRVLLLTGAGDFFSSGNDLSNFTSVSDTSQIEEKLRNSKKLLTRFVHAFIHFPKPIVAAVNGPAIGIAATLLGHCDFVYGSPGTTLSTPFMQLAQSPEGCSSLIFPETMGRLKANEMLLLGKKFNAKEALAANLLNDVLEATGDKFLSLVHAIAKQLASYPPQALQLSKRLIRNSRRLELMDLVNREEVELLGDRWASAECMEAVLNFFNRRQPRTAKL